MKRQKDKSDYRKLYIKPAPIGESYINISLRPQYHALIKQIIRLSGEKKITISGYICRVLDEHFKMYKDIINDLYVQDVESEKAAKKHRK